MFKIHYLYVYFPSYNFVFELVLQLRHKDMDILMWCIDNLKITAKYRQIVLQQLLENKHRSSIITRFIARWPDAITFTTIWLIVPTQQDNREKFLFLLQTLNGGPTSWNDYNWKQFVTNFVSYVPDLWKSTPLWHQHIEYLFVNALIAREKATIDFLFPKIQLTQPLQTPKRCLLRRMYSVISTMSSNQFVDEIAFVYNVWPLTKHEIAYNRFCAFSTCR